ncbi:UAA transporter [Pelagophyceae sp. CCMP2097]|nr:UAA transporter [Pelagophyceae sp. CCMP2097]|mmetsp:Transcript_3809/g.11632  ORF Transcript_3809/g.11632 Transcript_3809/m.11632 type:complete len:368 (+) Transcript_3809:77-1180(+)
MAKYETRRALPDDHGRAAMEVDPAASDTLLHKGPPADGRESRTARLGSAILGVFIFFMVHDALQERAFRQPGFRFGWFMTLVEIAVVSACAFVFEWQPRVDKTKEGAATEAAARRYIVGLAVALTLSQGTGSAALAYVNYPIKVAFKSSKLCPVMVFGALFLGKSFQTVEYAAAVLMCISLAVLSLADARASTAESAQVGLGCSLLTVAVFSDALIPNLQEKVLKDLHYPVGRMIVLSNTGCLLLVSLYVVANGELVEGWAWCRKNQAGAALLFVQAACSYAGLRCYLVVVREMSGVAGVVLTSLRKVLTLVLSFVLFEKPFGFAHLEGFFVLSLGVLLAAYANTKKKKNGNHKTSESDAETAAPSK